MSTHDQASGATRHGPLRTATWLILVVSATANSVASLVSAATVVHVGMTRRQVRAMVRRESALISAVAVASGTALAVVPLALLGQGFLSRPWPVGPLWLLPAAAAVVAVLTGTTTALATRRALRPGSP